MRNFLFCIFISVNAPAFAQDIALQNNWQKNSNTLYIGVQNTLLISGDASTVVAVTSPSASVKQNRDSLMINVHKPGTVLIHIELKDGSRHSFTYQSFYLPPFQVQLFKGNTRFENRIDQADLQSGCRIEVLNTENTLYTDYEITGFNISVDKETFILAGNTISKDKIPVIATIREGNRFIITGVSLFNKATGKKMQVGIQKEYTVL